MLKALHLTLSLPSPLQREGGLPAKGASPPPPSLPATAAETSPAAFSATQGGSEQYGMTAEADRGGTTHHHMLNAVIS